MISLRYALRLVVVVIVLGLLPMLFTPAIPSLTPYVSALSAIAAGDAFAAKPPPCENKVCDFSEPTIPACMSVRKSGTNCRVFMLHGMLTCEQTAC